MDCPEALHAIYHYLDGELTDDKRSEITKHLDACPPCANGFDFESELRSLVATKCREEVPDDLRRRIAQAIGHDADRDAGHDVDLSG